MPRARHTGWSLVGAAALLLIVVAPSELEAQEAEPVIRIGVVLPMSGPHRRLGEAAWDGLVWGRDRSGLPIELVLRDSEGERAEAAEAVEALAADAGIVAIVGPLGALESRSAAEAAEAAGVPLLSLSSAEGLESVGGDVFRLRVSPAEQSRAMAQLAVRHLGLERAGVFYPDTVYGRACAEAFARALEAEGGVLAGYEAYDPEDSKPNKEAELLSGRRVRVLRGGEDAPEVKLKKTGRPAVDFDHLFIPEQASGLPRVLSFLEVAGVPLGGDVGDVQLLGTSAWDGDGLRLAEGRVSRALVPMVFDAHRNEAVEDALAEFEERFGREATALEVQAFDGLLLVAAALERCRRDASRACLRQGLRSGARVDGLAGAFSLSREGAPVRTLLIFDVDASGALWPAY